MTVDDDEFINGYRLDLKTGEKTSIYGKDFNDELLELVYFKKPSLELVVFYGHKNVDGIFGTWTRATRNDMNNIIEQVQVFPKHIFSEKPFNCNSTITKTITDKDTVYKNMTNVLKNINCDEAKLLKRIRTTH